ncbi:MAG: hypothetical protein LBK83_05995 [Treponema sp.]|jgi:hypothetical protein|nr:hypothetical protein [Treponema sp.]
MNTGKEVKINDGTLVITTTFALEDPRKGGYISIFEFENGTWVGKKTINTKKYFKEPYQAPMNEWDSSDTIATIPFPPFMFKRNPGSVYILKIHPNGGYEKQGVITRKYNLFGKVKFVNNVK